ncbi:glycoside hydrolase family 36 protein [Streptomyces sp. bgisy031]|uniref:glycoside hydrolase family 36 protein n=1 Tax=Streptomyces sp. bgisy031 TaxID=3413772 RepID=UPI003D70A4F5
MTALPNGTAQLWSNDVQSQIAYGVTAALMSAGQTLHTEPSGDGTTVCVEAVEDGRAVIRLDVPLGDAVGYWHPSAGWNRHLPADWEGWRRVGLVDSAPIGCLFDSTGNAVLGFASDRLESETRIRFGVSEELARYGVWLAMDLAAGQTCRIRLAAPGQSAASALRSLTQWLATGEELAVPDAARVPAYSTWYSFHQDMKAAEVEAEAKIAADLGCGVLLLDDGWQLHAQGRGYAGCGDWTPDPVKFPDFTAHVRAVQGMGMRYVAWVAPLLLGKHSAAHEAMAAFAPHYAEGLDCRILDPRHEQARRFIVDTCAELVERYGLNGLKIDFLDAAMVYATAGDDVARDDVSQAMLTLLTQLRERLYALRGDDLLIELRQPYMGLAMLKFGNLLRAGDCPANAAANRVKTIDIAATAATGAIHSDMLMWHPAAPPEAAARQLQGAFYAIPQISVRLAEQSAEHREVTAFWLQLWREFRDVLTGGEVDAGRPDELYEQVTATSGSRAVITNYSERVIRLDLGRFTEVALINSTAADRVILDLTGDPARAELEVRDARGRRVSCVTQELRPGLRALPVPPAGVCRVRFA